MASGESAAPSQDEGDQGDGVFPSLRDSLVLQSDGSVNVNYPPAVISVQQGVDPRVLISAVLIAEAAGGGFVVAFPARCWHRQTNRRVISLDFVRRVTAVRVPFVSPEDRSTRLEGEVRVCLGVLTETGEGAVDLLTDFEGEVDVDYPFVAGEAAANLPDAQGLIDVSTGVFEFETAESGGPPGVVVAPESAQAEASGLEGRLKSLESCFASVQRDLQTLLRGQIAGVERGSGSGRGTGLDRTPTPAASLQLTGLDPSVVRAARQAGVPENHLEEMAKMISKQKKSLGDQAKSAGPPKVRTTEVQDALQDEPYQQDDPSSEPLPGDPLQAAVIRLTQIAGDLAASKKKDGSLEAILDGSGGGGSQDGSGGGSSSRKNAAALRMLRERMVSHPKELIANIEARMESDFAMRTPLPGASQIPVSCRAWLESRSKVQAYPTTVRFLWSIAGIADAIKQGKSDEGYLRCLLALAAGDQLSIDRGAWAVAAEVMLEESPPMGSFGVRALPQGPGRKSRFRSCWTRGG